MKEATRLLEQYLRRRVELPPHDSIVDFNNPSAEDILFHRGNRTASLNKLKLTRELFIELGIIKSGNIQ